MKIRSGVDEEIQVAEVAGGSSNELPALFGPREIRLKRHRSLAEALDRCCSVSRLSARATVVEGEITAGTGQAKSDGPPHADRGSRDESGLS